MTDPADLRMELLARWERVRRLMAEQDIDCIVALDLSRDDVMLSSQRWLTGYVPIGMPCAGLLTRGGAVELIGPMLGLPAADFYKGMPVQLTAGFSIQLIADRVAKHAPLRIGVVEPLAFPSVLADALTSRAPAPAIVDLSAQMLALRLRKTAYEIALIRRSCAIADQVWTQVVDVFRVGRRSYEVLADIDHLVRQHGAESGFNLVLPLPFQGMPMKVLADPAVIGPDARYLMEISPRYEGYYSQLTIPVTSYIDDVEAHDAHAAIVAAKAMAAPLMRPGADLRKVAAAVAGFLADRGYSMTSTSLGHFCGLGLEEPRDAPDRSFVLDEGMTMIFHPVLATPEYRSLMRGETYLITGDGAEKLNRYEGGVLHIS